MNKNKKIILLVLTIFLVFSDLSSKSLVKSIFHNNENAKTTQLIDLTSFLSIRNLCNNGVSFGILDNLSHKTMQILISIIFLILLIYSYHLIKSQQINLYGNFMIISGAIANLIDRFHNQCVYDFIDFHIKNHHFYVFNLADAFITIGAIIILFSKNDKKT